jgi:hypothetical protein
MKMDFPHSRNGASQITQGSNFAALVAIAAARQTQSRTVRAMLAPTMAKSQEPDSIDARIAYFARSRGARHLTRGGAFLPADQSTRLPDAEIHESAVNLDGSAICKAESVNRSLPADGQESRGMEV